MKSITIPAEKFTTSQEIHDYLQEVLAFPNYYGMNLDALYECLTEIDEKTKVVIPQTITEEDNLGEYGDRIIEVFLEAAEDNDKLQVIITQ